MLKSGLSSQCKDEQNEVLGQKLADRFYFRPRNIRRDKLKQNRKRNSALYLKLQRRHRAIHDKHEFVDAILRSEFRRNLLGAKFPHKLGAVP